MKVYDIKKISAMPRCPECGKELGRVNKRPFDRVLNLFVPVHRFHCSSFECGWEGNVIRTNRRLLPGRELAWVAIFLLLTFIGDLISGVGQ